jgi:hypothetical protein
MQNTAIMEEEKGKPGRKKITFTEEQLLEAERLAGLGFSEEALCKAVFGCSVTTLQRRKKEFANIEQYIRRGKLKSIEEVSAALFDSATGRNGRDPSVSAQIFFLKNKGKEAGNPWADIQQVENSINLSNVLENANTRIIEGKKVESLDKKEQFLIKNYDSSENN